MLTDNRGEDSYTDTSDDILLDVLDHALNPHAQQIEIKYHNSPTLEQIDKGGCIDLYNSNELVLKKGEFGFIDFGVAMRLPRGYDALIFPRSSTFKRWGVLLTNSVGYIDNSYCGTDDRWKVCVYATRDITIPAGTRCFQFRLIKTQPTINFYKVDRLNSINRDGFGSTG